MTSFVHWRTVIVSATCDRTGKGMDDYPDQEYAKDALRSFSTAVETRLPVARHNERVIEDRASGDEALHLPPSSDGARGSTWCSSGSSCRE